MSRRDPRPHYGRRLPRVTLGGYVAVYEPEHPIAMADGYVLQHRKVAWDAGQLRDPLDEVHHRNKDRSDNRLENLVVIPVAQHRAHHAAERRKDDTDCVRGHVGEVLRDRSGDRYCRACARERARLRSAASSRVLARSDDGGGNR